MADEDPEREAKDDNMMAFSIGVSQEEAAKLMQQKEEQLE
jgi:hypothetical protein